jgi:methyl-accepting chemotaxis protein
MLWSSLICDVMSSRSGGRSIKMAYEYTAYRFSLIMVVILGVFLLLLPAGCGQKSQRTIGSGVTPTTGQFSKQELGDQLDKFREYFKATLRQVANELNERVPSTRTEKTTLQMRARMVQGLNAMLDNDDSIVAFIETWALCTRFRMYLEEGEGSALFGDAHQIALDASKRLEAEIQRISVIFLKKDVFEATRKNVIEFAHNNPIRGTFSNVIVYATEVQEGQPNPFLNVLKIPMTPFRAIEGVDRTASAIHQFSDTADRFSAIVAELPESSRWQLQLLLFDLEEANMTKSFLSSLSQLSESSARLEKTAEKLPEQIREQLTQFVEDVDKRQTALQETLQQAEKTSLALNDTLEKLDQTAGSFNAVAKDVTETAQAWENAAKATGEIVQEFNKIKPSPQEEKSSFDIKDYRDTAEQTSRAANDIKALLAEIEDLLESRRYDSVLNGLLLRVAGLVVLIFVLAVLYRIISIRLAISKGRKAD